MGKPSYLLKAVQIMVLLVVAFMVTSGGQTSLAATSPVMAGDYDFFFPFLPGPSQSDPSLFMNNEVNGSNNGTIQFIQANGIPAAPYSSFSLSLENIVHLAIDYAPFDDSPYYSSVISTDGPVNSLISWRKDSNLLPGMYRATAEGESSVFLGPILNGQAEPNLWIQNASMTPVDILVDFLGLDGEVVSQAQINNLNPNASHRVEELNDLPDNFIGWVRAQSLTSGGTLVGLLSHTTPNETHFLEPSGLLGVQNSTIQLPNATQRVLVPRMLRHVNEGGGLRTSKLLVGNPNSSTVNVRVEFYPLVGADVTLGPIELVAFNAKLFDLASISTLQDGEYAVIVGSSQPLYVGQVTLPESQNGTRLGGYGSDEGQLIVLPRVQNTSEAYSIISIQHAACTSTFNIVQLQYLRDGDQLQHTEVLSLLCNKSIRIDLRDVEALGEDFSGALIMSAASSGTIRAWVDEYATRLPPNPTSDHLPLIFIPGVAGSVLSLPGNAYPLWPNILAPDENLQLLINELPRGRELSSAAQQIQNELAGNASNLTLDPSVQGYRSDVYASDVFRRPFGKDFYGSFLEELNAQGYIPYDIAIKRPGAACDTTQTAPTPNLFVFPYDWRKSIAENAIRLENYVSCVRTLWPNQKIDIVAHSMGGLVARRYILDQQSASQPHHIHQLITLGAPWWGAPQMLWTLETGNFGEPVNLILLNKNTLKSLVATFPGAHELLPSRAYIDAACKPLSLYRPPLIEDGWDMNGNGKRNDEFCYNDFYKVVGERYLYTPMVTNEKFHSFSGQDNWSSDQSAITYTHILGNAPQTIGHIKAKQFCTLLIFKCNERKFIVPDPFGYTLGDGTVPGLSAQGVDFTGGQQSFLTILSKGELSHSALLANPDVKLCVFQLLQEQTCPDAIPTVSATATPMYYHVLVVGGGKAMAKDFEGNITGSVGNGLEVDYIPGVSFYPSADDISTFILPTTTPYTLTFTAGETPLYIEVQELSEITPTKVVRYVDLSVPTQANLSLSLPLVPQSALRYDSNGDGIAETTVVPTVAVEGPQAIDNEPPVVTFQVDKHLEEITVTLAANDPAGVDTIYYSFDSTTYQTYSGPISISVQQADYIDAFADDKLANRSEVTTKQLFEAPAGSNRVYLPAAIR